ncbi:STAS domain-containing protein [Propionivibrio dicarboxylicus]|uniref:Phospholipid transport system transporter-binding protein n=1 Tax=Propionivibrio dicarboxylicus TaxID=83767 RepID=A0A1G8FSB6_9RHOO|nr:STAS domain-containing protein [Propionivibrio dicarboxylicus]SDH85007.1 phospholipid transport system transporter-binding protein [Propionivibrio dicarboxylicus]
MIERNGNALEVSGAMLNGNATALLEAGRGLLRAAEKTAALQIDLSAVTETDASALAVVFAWLRTAQQAGIELRIASLPASMVSQAKLYGVFETLPLA